MRYVVDWMRLADIPVVTQIEQASFGDAWPSGSYERELIHNRLAHYLVVRETPELPSEQMPAVEMRYATTREDDYGAPPRAGTVVGLVGMWLMFDETHITTLAVAPERRGRGLGELLLVAALDVAAVLGSALVTLEVRVSNVAAQRLYEKYGLVPAGLRRGYYSDNHEDALIMTSEPVGSAAFQNELRRLRAANRERLTRLCAAQQP